MDSKVSNIALPGDSVELPHLTLKRAPLRLARQPRCPHPHTHRHTDTHREGLCTMRKRKRASPCITPRPGYKGMVQ